METIEKLEKDIKKLKNKINKSEKELAQKEKELFVLKTDGSDPLEKLKVEFQWLMENGDESDTLSKLEYTYGALESFSDYKDLNRRESYDLEDIVDYWFEHLVFEKKEDRIKALQVLDNRSEEEALNIYNRLGEIPTTGHYTYDITWEEFEDMINDLCKEGENSWTRDW